MGTKMSIIRQDTLPFVKNLGKVMDDRRKEIPCQDVLFGNLRSCQFATKKDKRYPTYLTNLSGKKKFKNIVVERPRPMTPPPSPTPTIIPTPTASPSLTPIITPLDSISLHAPPQLTELPPKRNPLENCLCSCISPPSPTPTVEPTPETSPEPTPKTSPKCECRQSPIPTPAPTKLTTSPTPPPLVDVNHVCKNEQTTSTENTSQTKSPEQVNSLI